MSNTIQEFSKFHQKVFEEFTKWQSEPGLFEEDCADIISELGGAHDDDIQKILQVTHKAQRVGKIFAAGLQGNPDLRQALDKAELPLWNSFEALPISAEIQRSLADKLYNITSIADDIAVLEIGDKSRLIAECLLKRLKEEGVDYSIVIRDPDFLSLLLSHASPENIQALGEYELAKSMNATKRMAAFPITQDEIRVAEPIEAKQAYDKVVLPFRLKSLRGEVLSTLTLLPTRAEADIDHIPYKDYVRMFGEMCDQPWSHISDAQKFLIEKFNQASHARFTNEWGTDVEMELADENGVSFTFCNSLIAKNVPGSEIFSAPRKDSVNGRIVSYGRFHNGDSKIIENLRLHFENGRLATYGAEKGIEHFERFIDADPGHSYVGELGIGTNPHLKQHVSNGLLVEKIGGSFHLALGNAYTMTDYLGDPVYVDNGNRALDHWDITTMLYGAGGRIYLDGELIMDDGYFIDERLDVLNRGWNAIPQEKRPDYWQCHMTPFKLDI